jgi:hypothetical protein
LDPDRVAVVPFVYRTGVDSLQLGTILGEMVTNELTAAGVVVAPFVNVMAASAQLERGGTPGDLNAIARETRAGIIVSGSYFLRPARDSLSIQATVHDVRRDRPLASVDLVTVPVAEQFQGIESVVQRVLVVLSSRLNPHLAQIAPLVDLPMNMEAYREYAAGLERSGVDDYRATRAALEHYYAALRLDSTSASALNAAALAEWQANGNLPKVDSLLLILARYKRDLQPYELAHHDWLRAWLDGNLMGSLLATREMSRLSGHTVAPQAQDALRLNFLDEANKIRKELKTPLGRTSTWTYQHLTDVLHRRGEHRAEYRQARRASEEIGETRNTLFFEIQALAALGADRLRERLERLKAIDASHRGFRDAAYELRWHGHPQEADSIGRLAELWYRQVLERAPTPPEYRQGSPGARHLLAETLFDLGRWEEARSVFDSLAAEARPGADTTWQGSYYESYYDVVALGYIGVDEAMRGDTIAAEAMINRLGGVSRPFLFGTNVYWQARIAGQLGDCERTVDFLELAMTLGSSAYYQQGWNGLEIAQFADLDCQRFKQFSEEKD